MKKILIALSLCGVLVSCNKFLDMTPRDSISDKVMWADVESAEYAVNDIYSYTYEIVAEWPSAVGMTEAFTDAFKYGSYVNFAFCLIPSQVAYGGTNLTSSFVNVYLGRWGDLYDAVRRTNEAISNLKTLGANLPEADRVRLEGELRLMRGWLYFELVKRYKEVILYDEDLTQIKVEKALSSEADGWNFIWNDLDFASRNLPEKAAAKGRLDKGAALALITRAMLYAGEYDKVVAAADELAGLGYALMPDYGDAFTVPVTAGNTETILQYSFSYADNETHEFDFYYTPGGDYKLVGQQGGGYGTPTQEMVESYELATGGFPDWSPWHGETLAEPPYERLEPRFKATILYNGAPWKGRTIEPFVGGTDGWCQWNKEPKPEGRTTTGYYLRKGVDETHNLAERSQSIQPFIILRYGEVLLNSEGEPLYTETIENNAEGKGGRLSKRILIYLYDTTRCSFCRERVVRELGRRGLLTDDTLTACLHDASVDIRDYAKRFLSRRRAKVTSNPVQKQKARTGFWGCNSNRRGATAADLV